MSRNETTDWTAIFIILLLCGGALYTILSFCVTGAKLYIHSCDIYKNLKYLTRGKSFTVPYNRLVLSITLFSLLSIGFYFTKETFTSSVVNVILFVPSLGFLIMTLGRIINSYLEIVSEFIASIRYEKVSGAKENQWRQEQEQWLLLLDLINTSVAKGETHIQVDASICGKDFPLTSDNRWKLRVLDYAVDNLNDSQIKLRYSLPCYL